MENGIRPGYAPTNRARSFRDFLSGYAGGMKPRPGPYDRPEDMGAIYGGYEMPAPTPTPTRAIPGSIDDPTVEALVSRTLYLCKLPADCSEDNIREIAAPFGDIRKNTVYAAKQIAFVEYWDIRCAEKARTALKQSSIAGKRIDCQFSYARNDRVKDGNTGTLYIRPVTSDRAFIDPNSVEQYHELFSTFGEIKKISSNRKREAEKFVEYYDLRASEAALQELNGKDFNGVMIEIQFANHSSKTINSDSKLNTRRPYDDYPRPYGGGGGGGSRMMGGGVSPGHQHQHQYYPPSSGSRPPHGGALIDPYGYAPPPMMAIDPYWSYMWGAPPAGQMTPRGGGYRQ